MARSLDSIDKEIAQLLAQKQKLKTVQDQQKRALETKQKVILGGWLLTNDPMQVQKIIEQLKRPQDRKAFDLPPLNATEDPTAA